MTEPAKIAAASANVAEAGPAQFAVIGESNAMKSAATHGGPIDFLLRPGSKGVYPPTIRILSPKMRAERSFRLTIFSLSKRRRALNVARMQDRANGFESVTLPIGHGMEYSLRLK
jgi:hypothetical protein